MPWLITVRKKARKDQNKPKLMIIHLENLKVRKFYMSLLWTRQASPNLFTHQLPQAQVCIIVCCRHRHRTKPYCFLYTPTAVPNSGSNATHKTTIKKKSRSEMEGMNLCGPQSEDKTQATQLIYWQLPNVMLCFKLCLACTLNLTLAGLPRKPQITTCSYP